MWDCWQKQGKETRKEPGLLSLGSWEVLLMCWNNIVFMFWESYHYTRDEEVERDDFIVFIPRWEINPYSFLAFSLHCVECGEHSQEADGSIYKLMIKTMVLYTLHRTRFWRFYDRPSSKQPWNNEVENRCANRKRNGLLLHFRVMRAEKNNKALHLAWRTLTRTTKRTLETLLNDLWKKTGQQMKIH